MKPFYNCDPENVLAPSYLRVLVCILEMASAGKHITVRSIVDHLKQHSTNWIPQVLRRLKQHGLISYENKGVGTGKGGATGGGTIRPRCYLRMFKETLP